MSLFGFMLPRWAVYLIGALIVLAAFIAVIRLYGHERYKAGKADADKAWQAASDKLIAQAQNSAAKADQTKAARDADFAARVEDEKEKLDAANENGASSFDVLFGTSR